MLTRESLLTILIAAALAIPIALPPAFGYETNPAFLLAPFVGWAVVSSRTTEAGLFIVSIVLGLGSIFIAWHAVPDNRLFKDILSLVLLTFSAGFYFLGKRLSNFKQLVFWLCVFSSIFLIPPTIRLLTNGQPVRAVSLDDYTYLNVFLFGFPIFASVGLNALVHLICIQAALLCGTILDSKLPIYTQAVFALALASAAFLIVGSDSRSAMVFLACLVGWFPFYVYRNKSEIIRVAVLILIIGIGASWALLRLPSENRLSVSVGTVADAVGDKLDSRAALSESTSIIGTTEGSSLNVDRLTSGRITLAKIAVDEFLSSPIIGTGFSPFGRYHPVDPYLKLSATTHVYYLTILWKGGLLFGIPFLAFLALIASRTIMVKPWTESPEAAFAFVATALTFGPISFTYDTPNVPSAGALAFLLLGALSEVKNRNLSAVNLEPSDSTFASPSVNAQESSSKQPAMPVARPMLG
jgi:hypothetical protein